MRVTPPDIELWLVGHVRACAVADGLDIEVGNKEPSSLRLPLSRPVLIIRDDSGGRLGYTTFDRSIGASVLAGTKQNDKPANDLARWLTSVLLDDALPLVEGSPVVAVDWDGSNGPYAVTETLDVARRYLTAQYVVAGSW